MTSLLGIEALIRGKAVTCLGLSFYSGWGLTQDQREVPGRQARPDILPLIHIYLNKYKYIFIPIDQITLPT
jgi:capsular polysaccharide export protein